MTSVGVPDQTGEVSRWTLKPVGRAAQVILAVLDRVQKQCLVSGIDDGKRVKIGVYHHPARSKIDPIFLDHGQRVTDYIGSQGSRKRSQISDAGRKVLGKRQDRPEGTAGDWTGHRVGHGCGHGSDDLTSAVHSKGIDEALAGRAKLEIILGHQNGTAAVTNKIQQLCSLGTG